MADKSEAFCEISHSNLEKLSRAWARMIDCITHDLTTPLVTLRMTGENTGNLFANLVEGYKLAVKNNLIEAAINERHLKLLEKILVSEIKNNTSAMIEFLRLLHPLNQALLSNSEEIQLLDAKSCIEATLNKYPFSDEKERSLIQVDYKYNFKFSCSPLFMEQLFSNLLSNALYCIKQTGKGKINICIEEEHHYYVVRFKDTAKGMDDLMLLQIFNRFFSRRNNEIVPGLGFCRLAILQKGGDVLCHAVKGEFTEFVIKFPKTT